MSCLGRAQSNTWFHMLQNKLEKLFCILFSQSRLIHLQKIAKTQVVKISNCCLSGSVRSWLACFSQVPVLHFFSYYLVYYRIFERIFEGMNICQEKVVWLGPFFQGTIWSSSLHTFAQNIWKMNVFGENF